MAWRGLRAPTMAEVAAQLGTPDDQLGNFSLRARGRECRVRFQRMLQQRPGVAAHVKSLEAAMTYTTKNMRKPLNRARQPSVAVLIRGQTFRGTFRETFRVDQSDYFERAADQTRCMRSMSGSSTATETP